MNAQRHYPSDLSNAQWALIEPYFDSYYRRGGNPQHSRRRLLNAMLYVARGGISWRMLPKEYPPWETVYSCFRRWQRGGLLLKIHESLRKQVRIQAGKHESPSTAIIDSQSARTTEKGGLAALMEPRKSTAASDTSSSTHSE